MIVMLSCLLIHIWLVILLTACIIVPWESLHINKYELLNLGSVYIIFKIWRIVIRSLFKKYDFSIKIEYTMNLIEMVNSMADKEAYCAFYDKSMKFLPLVEHILRVILICGGELDLTSDDL